MTQEDWPLGNPHPDDAPPEVPAPVAPTTVEDRLAGVDVKALRHGDQEKVSDNSTWKVECPFCTEGLFLVARDQKTHVLQEYDTCLGCRQVVHWLDIEDMRSRDGHGRSSDGLSCVGER